MKKPRKHKQLSNSFSTGGGGGQFESHVQASFVALMFTGGFAPCLPCWPINKIKLQGKFAGYDTDDLIVFVENTNSIQKRRMLAQIKHSISITEKNEVFSEVIQSAWNDFNNADVFTRNSDVIALITGPLSATDVDDVRPMLEWARHMENAEEFIRSVALTNFSSANKQKKLRAFRTQLQNANGGTPVTDNVLFQFLKHFHLLSYDLDVKAGVTLSLLHSLIGQHSQDNAQALWSRLVDEVQSANKNAGTITRDSLPDDLQDVFKQRVVEVIPEALSFVHPTPEKTNWNQHAYASDLAIANLLGTWNEKSEADIAIIQRFNVGNYDAWIGRLREILQLPDSPLALKNNKWSVKDRKALWESLGTRLFDSSLDIFRQCVITVLTERDPQFDLPSDNRFAANIHGKVLSHSLELRKGMAETLALLGNRPKPLSNCSQNKADTTAILAVREILDKAGWVLWGSLNHLLPTLAEAAPDEFLKAVEVALHQQPCPFEELFGQEGDGISGGNYLTGLLWALESLAWDQTFLVQACVILANLAAHDPGGSWSNRPANSLAHILLPWLPQTTASIEKRMVALVTIEKEVPSVAWKLVLSLLPNQLQSSSGTHKPTWRGTIPDDWEKGVSHKEYWEQVSSYAELAVSMARDDFEKLNELVNHLGNLPRPSFDEILALLSSEAITSKPEEERLTLWTRLADFALKHRRFSDAKWALDADTVSKIESIAAKLAPNNPLNLHRRLFSGNDFDLYEENGNWKEQREKLEQRRREAIQKILDYSGIDAVIQCAKSVESPSQVGRSLGSIADAMSDAIILPAFLVTEDKRLDQFVSGYVWSRHSKLGWSWVDEPDRSDWSKSQVATFLSYLPFTSEAWTRATVWLGHSEREYWSRTSANPYQTPGDLGPAVDKLIEFGRPRAALNCLDLMRQEEHPLDKVQIVKALMAAVSSEESSHAMDTYRIAEFIKTLQDDPSTNPDDLFRVEWAYLPLLNRYEDASPKLLERKLASDPKFFCEVIRLVYRSKKEEAAITVHSEHDKAFATNAWRLLHKWQTPPGAQPDGSFSQEQFRQWLHRTKKICVETGHLEVALIHVGQVLFYCPPDPQGLWIDKAAADALNNTDAEEMRSGFRTEIYNSRGFHRVDPTGKPERELAKEYRQKADQVENASYQRLAATLRKLAESYERDAERIIAEHPPRKTE